MWHELLSHAHALHFYKFWYGMSVAHFAAPAHRMCTTNKYQNSVSQTRNFLHSHSRLSSSFFPPFLPNIHQNKQCTNLLAFSSRGNEWLYVYPSNRRVMRNFCGIKLEYHTLHTKWLPISNFHHYYDSSLS